MKRTKKPIQLRKPVQIIVYGVSPEGGRETMVRRICEKVGFKPRREE